MLSLGRSWVLSTGAEVDLYLEISPLVFGLRALSGCDYFGDYAAIMEMILKRKMLTILRYTLYKVRCLHVLLLHLCCALRWGWTNYSWTAWSWRLLSRLLQRKKKMESEETAKFIKMWFPS